MLDSDNPMGRVMMATLILEAITIALAIPVMIMVDHQPAGLATAAGGGVVLLALVGGAMMRRGLVGYLLGWLTQIAALALGLLTSGMFAMGALFAALWVVCFILGRRLATKRAEFDRQA